MTDLITCNVGDIIDYTPEHILKDDKITRLPVYKIHVPSLNDAMNVSRYIKNQKGFMEPALLTRIMRDQIHVAMPVEERAASLAIVEAFIANEMKFDTPGYSTLHWELSQVSDRYRAAHEALEYMTTLQAKAHIHWFVKGIENGPVEFRTDANGRFSVEAVEELVALDLITAYSIYGKILTATHPPEDAKKNSNPTSPSAASLEINGKEQARKDRKGSQAKSL